MRNKVVYKRFELVQFITSMNTLCKFLWNKKNACKNDPEGDRDQQYTEEVLKASFNESQYYEWKVYNSQLLSINEKLSHFEKMSQNNNTLYLLPKKNDKNNVYKKKQNHECQADFPNDIKVKILFESDNSEHMRFLEVKLQVILALWYIINPT